MNQESNVMLLIMEDEPFPLENPSLFIPSLLVFIIVQCSPVMSTLLLPDSSQSRFKMHTVIILALCLSLVSISF